MEVVQAVVIVGGITVGVIFGLTWFFNNKEDNTKT